MSETLALRKCEESDAGAVADLINRIFGARWDDRYWNAKYFGNPAGPSLSVLAFDGDRAVGQIGAIPARFRAQGKEVVAAQELDVAIEEAHRSFGLYLQLFHLQREVYKERGIEFSYGISNELTAQISDAFQITKRIKPVPRLVKVLDVAPFLKRKTKLGRLAGLVAPAGNAALKVRYAGKAKVPGGTALRQVERFDERFDRFWERIRDDYPIMLVRDAAYLDWRYREAANMRFDAFAVEDAGTGEVHGFTILGEGSEDFAAGQIFDIVTPRSGDAAVARCLLRHAVDHFRQKKAAMVKCWMFEHCHLRLELTGMGFVPREKEGRDLLYQAINPDEAVPAQLAAAGESWFLSKGDSDNY